MCWVVLFFEGWDFFKTLFNWWNLSCQILWLFHHSLLFRLHFIFFFSCSNTFFFFFPLYHCQILFSKLSSTWASKKRKSPPLSKRENPLVTLERSMSTWQVDWVISPHLTVKQWLGEVDSGNIKCPKSEQPLGGEKNMMMIQYKIPKW